MRKIQMVTQGFIVLLLIAFAASCGSTSTNSTPAATKPSHPVILTIDDAGGYGPEFAQAMINAFVQANPDQVSKVVFDPRIQAPQLPAKLAAQEAAGHVTTSLVLTGYDGLSASIKQSLVEQLLPKYNDLFQSSVSNYVASAATYQTFANGYGLVFATTPSGPLFEYNPA
ncbi:MAG TPA: hypothetical protein VKB76_17350, partial [Ktedonobacterales bacterium]|nr:hypothetical protein [Ktedonobacterales bacterium]